MKFFSGKPEQASTGSFGSPAAGGGQTPLYELLETMVKNIVDHPEEVEINELAGQASIFFEMRVHPNDVGKVIGREGRIINAMRTILKAAGGREQRQVELKLLSED